jgi:hypothetical protein
MTDQSGARKFPAEPRSRQEWYRAPKYADDRALVRARFGGNLPVRRLRHFSRLVVRLWTDLK